MIYRGVRIYKVMYYYEDYWNLMKKYDDKSIDRRVSTFMNREEQLRLDKAREWREIILIQKMALYILAPLLALALISYFVKELFPVVPALSYLSCYKHFGDDESSSCGMKFTNQIMFIILNWFEIAGLSLLFWKIRNIQNELNIKKEV
jgi:hypothetical protein